MAAAKPKTMDDLIERPPHEGAELEQGGGADRLAKQKEAGQAHRPRAH